MKFLTIALFIACVAIAHATPVPSGWGWDGAGWGGPGWAGLGWGGLGWGGHGWAGHGHGQATLVGPSTAAVVQGPLGTGAIATKQIGGVVSNGWSHGPVAHSVYGW